MTMIKHFCSLTLALCTLAACTFNIRPAVPAIPLGDGNRTLLGCEATVLVPEEFLNREYVSSFEGREIRIRIGEPAAEAVEALIRSRFTVVTMKSVTGDGTLDFLRTVTASERNERLVMRPRITRLESSVRPFRYNLEFGLAVDVAGLAAPATPSGSGVGTAGLYSQAEIQRAADEALFGAVAALASAFPSACK